MEAVWVCYAGLRGWVEALFEGLVGDYHCGVGVLLGTWWLGLGLWGVVVVVVGLGGGGGLALERDHLRILFCVFFCSGLFGNS